MERMYTLSIEELQKTAEEKDTVIRARIYDISK